MAKPSTPLVGVYTHKTGCMLRDVFPVLQHYGLPFLTLGQAELRTIEPGDVDVLLFPGGWYSFTKSINKRIRTFVSEGGGFVGICCGAINACRLGLINADMYQMGGIGPMHIYAVDPKHPVLKGMVKRAQKKAPGYAKIDILRYNGWPMALKEGAHMIASLDMEGKLAAIASSDYGKGRAVAFCPHPEGATCAPGTLRDRDKHPMVYDGIAMGTARMLDNAIRWAAS